MDMFGVGTLVNLTASLLAVVAVIQEAPSLLAFAVHVAPLLYNALSIRGGMALPRSERTRLGARHRLVLRHGIPLSRPKSGAARLGAVAPHDRSAAVL
jgi:hypothetical protein